MSFLSLVAARARGFVDLATGRPQLSVFLPALLLTAYWLAGEAAMVTTAIAIPAGLGVYWIADLIFGHTRTSPKAHSMFTTRRTAEDMLTRGIRTHPQTGKNVAVVALELTYDTDAAPALTARETSVLGHQVASVLAMAIREEDHVVSLGPFTFAVALSPSRHAALEAMIDLAKRLQDRLAEPQNLAGYRHFDTACVGICLPGRSTAPTGQALLDCAEIALNEAKSKGHGAICTFSPRLKKDRALRNSLSHDLNNAIETGQIRPVFQPQVHAQNGQIASVHAEPGWAHPQQGKIAQSSLMPMIAESGRQGEVDRQILSQIARQLRHWDECGPHIPFMSYRLHAATLEDARFPDHLAWEVDRYNLSADRICIGLPEAWVAAKESELANTVVSRLAAMGVPLEIQGFGKTHLTLPDFAAYGIDRVILDPAFSLRIDRDPEQQRYARALVEMSHNLSLQAVIRGIDTAAEFNAARDIRCDVIQGLAICGPLGAEDAMRWLLPRLANADGGRSVSAAS